MRSLTSLCAAALTCGLLASAAAQDASEDRASRLATSWAQLLGDDEGRIEAAAEALADLRPEVEARIPDLVAAIRDPARRDVTVLVRLLAEIGPGSAHEGVAAAAIAEQIDGPRWSSFAVLCDQLRAFKGAARPHADAIVAVIAAMRPGPEGTRLEQYQNFAHATDALAELCAAPADAPYLIELSRHEARLVQRLALAAMSQPACLDRLLEALADDDEEIRAAARPRLSLLRGEAGRILPALATQLRERTEDHEREATARLMAGFGEAALPHLAALVGDAKAPPGARIWAIRAWSSSPGTPAAPLTEAIRIWLRGLAAAEEAAIAEAAQQTLDALPAD